jgi:hypothetical protein
MRQRTARSMVTLYNNGHGPSRGFVMVPGLGQDNYRYMLGVELTGSMEMACRTHLPGANLQLAIRKRIVPYSCVNELRGFVMVPGLGQDNYRYMLGVELTGNSRSESPPREALRESEEH